MKQPRHVFTFGCPHSGTTYLWKLMLRMQEHAPKNDPFIVKRIPEESLLHPCQTNTGLLGLAATFYDSVFIRIVRDPVEVFKSFLAERHELHPACDVAIHDDDRILRYIVNERRNMKQMQHVPTESARLYKRGGAPIKGRLINVSYEELDTIHGRQEFAGHVNAEFCGLGWHLLDDMKETWKKDIAREGRLSTGIKVNLEAGHDQEIRRAANSDEAVNRTYP